MKGRFLFTFLLFLLASALLIPFSAYAASTPSFPSCSSPSGNVVANNTTGEHGVAGDQTSYSGSDVVFDVGSGNYLQCLCDNGNGIQTNWVNASGLSQNEIQSKEAQGFIYIPNGSAWGLSDNPYLAQNLSLSCSGSNQTNNSTSNNNGPSNQSTLAPVCNDTIPGSQPVITSIIPGQNSVTITWTKALPPVTSYLIAYGTQPGVYQFGNPNVGDQNTTTYTIMNLSGGQTYYFAVRAQNGCMPGPFSNEVSNSVSGSIIQDPAKDFSSNVLGASDPKIDGISFTQSICTSCFWWPVLLGEIITLCALYLLARRKNIRVNRILLGGAFAGVAYVVFLIINKGHVCPDGSITLWIFSLPCRYFWVFDAGVFVLLTLLFRSAKPVKKAAK